jgi:hypothetical protein
MRFFAVGWLYGDDHEFDLVQIGWAASPCSSGSTVQLKHLKPCNFQHQAQFGRHETTLTNCNQFYLPIQVKLTLMPESTKDKILV